MGQDLPANAGDVRDVCLIPGSGRSPGGRPRQSTLAFLPGQSQARDRGAWWATVHRVTESQTRLKWLSAHTRRHRGVTVWKQIRWPSTNLQTSSLHIYEEIDVCFLSCPVCGSWLWQPQLTDTGPISSVLLWEHQESSGYRKSERKMGDITQKWEIWSC